MNIRFMDLDMASVICKTSRESLLAFLHRIGLWEEKEGNKESLAQILKEAILSHPETILYIESEEALSFLIKLWESETIEMTQQDWDLLGQLQYLGFLDYSLGKENTEDGCIYLIREAWEKFYYYLKSRTVKMKIQRYSLWERLIQGIMRFYGILSSNRLYFYFCKCLMEPVDDETFHLFLAARINLWGFGCFAREKNSGIEYYENFEVQNPDQVLNKCEEEKDFDYKRISRDEILFVADNDGFGQWDGIGNLADVFMEELEIEYYHTVIMIKTCLLMVQNGETKEKILESILKWYPEGEKVKEKICTGVELIYRSVPVYELKGWSRNELGAHLYKKKRFTILEGGKES